VNVIRSVLDRDRVVALADDRFLERGQRYATEGRVHAVDEDDSAIAGTVSGTHDYEVRIWVEDLDLAYACDCPIGVDGTFCKHLVALAIAWLDRSSDGSGAKRPDPRASRDRTRPITMTDVRTYLDGQDHGTLVEMILAEADRDEGLRERLLLRTTLAASAGAGAGQIRRAIDRAVRVQGFVDYGGAYDYARGIHDAIDLIEGLLKDGQPAVVIELSEHALRRVEQAIETVDDSDGEMGGLLERLQELHLAACRAGRPDPEELATRLFAWELGDEWDVFHGAPETYADVLGVTGLAGYRRLAQAEWAKVPALGPESGEGRPYSSRRYRVTSIMESLARAAGDVDELVAVKSRDLSVAYHFFEIAQVCLDAEREDEALDWAERGVRAFPTATDSRLRELLAELYHRRSRHEEAMALIWAEFLEDPSLERYRLLKAHADRVETWPVWRTRALEAARDSIVREQGAARPASHWWESPADGSALVRIHLWEGEPERAWQEAVVLGCSDALWHELAVKREPEHPDDALPIYQREVDTMLDTKRNEGYEAAVKLLGRIRALMTRLGNEGTFPGYLAAVRAAHGRKRNFIKLLDKARW
jgi:tetratricopeptide (TPR) repeat protein